MIFLSWRIWGWLGQGMVGTRLFLAWLCHREWCGHHGFPSVISFYYMSYLLQSSFLYMLIDLSTNVLFIRPIPSKMARFQFVLQDALQSAFSILQNKGRSLGLLVDLVIKLGSSHRGYFCHKWSENLFITSLINKKHFFYLYTSCITSSCFNKCQLV